MQAMDRLIKKSRAAAERSPSWSRRRRRATRSTSGRIRSGRPPAGRRSCRTRCRR